MFVERVPGGVRHLVVGPGMQPVVTDPPVVVAVDHLTDQQGAAVGPRVVAHAAELAPEIGVDLVRHVEAPAVDADFFEPKTSHVEDVISHRRFVQVQPREHWVSFPAVVGEPGTLDGVRGAPALVVPLPRADVKPVAKLAGVRALLFEILKGKVLRAGVVEHAVQDNLDADVVQLLHNFLEQLHVTEAPVNLEVVEGVVAVRAGFKEGRKVDGVDAEFAKVLVVRPDLLQTRVDRELLVVHGRRAKVPEGKDLVKNRVS